jgi:hypothetical protein
MTALVSHAGCTLSVFIMVDGCGEKQEFRPNKDAGVCSLINNHYVATIIVS